MIRFVSAIGVALLGLICFGLYNGVYRVKAQEKELAELKADIAREGEAIRVLKAEWTYLNQPDRLQALARRHLALAPTGASQITVLASLPLKPATSTTKTPVIINANDLPSRVVPSAPLPRAKPALPAKAAP